jgi:hypothetical protein
MKTVRNSRGRQIIAATKKNAAQTISRAVDNGLEVMLALVPVASGDLKSTLMKKDDGQGHGMLKAGGPSQISEMFVDYELDVEFGTDEESAQPFFRLGVDAARQTIKKGMKVTDK